MMWSVSELAKHCNVTADTVRYYTRVGLLRPEHHPVNSKGSVPGRSV